MTIQQIVRETIQNIINAEFTVESNGGETIWKLNGEAVAVTGSN